MLQILHFIGRRGAMCCCVICKQPFPVDDRFIAQKVHAGDQCNVCKTLPNNPPSQALLYQIYDYDPITGLLRYKRDFVRRHKGDDPTSIMANGYLSVSLDKRYLAHRIIWLMQTGQSPDFVDHINHIRSDNRWSNLRDTSRQENAQNKSINKNNTSGYLGVSFMPRNGKFRASITKERRHIHLGLFDTAEEAAAARQAANQEHAFHLNHGSE